MTLEERARDACRYTDVDHDSEHCLACDFIVRALRDLREECAVLLEREMDHSSYWAARIRSLGGVCS